MDFKSIPPTKNFYIIRTLSPPAYFGNTNPQDGSQSICLFSSPREVMRLLEDAEIFGVVVHSVRWSQVMQIFPAKYKAGILDYSATDTDAEVIAKQFLFADLLPQAA